MRITSRLNRSVSPINWNLSRHGFVVFCVFLVCLCFVCVCFGVFVCFVFLVLVSVLRFVLWNVTKPLDYVSVLFQFTFAATTASAPA